MGSGYRSAALTYTLVKMDIEQLPETIGRKLFCTESTLQPLLKCRKQKEYSSVIHDQAT